MKKVVGIIFAGLVAVSQPALASDDQIQISAYKSRLETALLKYQKGQYEMAFEDMLKFAKAGDKLCQYLVATMYLQGQGTKMNSMEGYVWLNVALEQERAQWRELLGQLDNNVDDAFRAEAAPIIADYISRFGVKAQKMACRNRRDTGSNRRRMVCDKMQVRNGFYYIGTETGLI